MPQALSETGITNFAADNSRQADQYTLGGAVSVPRHPSSIYYNVSTWAELVDEYNQIYLEPDSGGKCVNTAVTTCRTTPATQSEILALETQIMLRNAMSNDPRPGYSHQSNLAGDQLILQLLGNVLSTYRSYYTNNAPVVTPTQAAAGAELGRQKAWRAAVQGNRVQASVKDGVVTVTATENLDIPLTLPSGSMLPATTTTNGRKTTTTPAAAYGQSYAQSQSAWTQVKRGTTFTVTVGA
jgi:hypothetical protein